MIEPCRFSGIGQGYPAKTCTSVRTASGLKARRAYDARSLRALKIVEPDERAARQHERERPARPPGVPKNVRRASRRGRERQKPRCEPADGGLFRGPCGGGRAMGSPRALSARPMCVSRYTTLVPLPPERPQDRERCSQSPGSGKSKLKRALWRRVFESFASSGSSPAEPACRARDQDIEATERCQSAIGCGVGAISSASGA